MKKKSVALGAIDIAAVQSRMLTIRNQQVLLDRDVAALYGVQTKEINQAIRNNPGKFPEGFVFQLNEQEFGNWKSKILTSNLSVKEIAVIKMGIRRAPYALTERGLYMLATILKGDVATHATLAIVNTYAQVRSMVRDMEAIQTEKAVQYRVAVCTILRHRPFLHLCRRRPRGPGACGGTDTART